MSDHTWLMLGYILVMSCYDINGFPMNHDLNCFNSVHNFVCFACVKHFAQIQHR